MKIATTVAELKTLVSEARNAGKSVGLVPTMGALHDGHISLVDRARRDNDIVVVSVFVNPTQFNNPNDLATYPRTLEADCARLQAAGVDVVFAPSVEEVYPEPDNRIFDLGPVAEVMEGAMRPGHFNGVAQIVSKLFDMVRPDRAYFGEKDYQQIAVIRRMVELEGFDLEIVPCPIVRHPDGLAMSSRNVRLTAHQRDVAPNIRRVLLESLAMAPGLSPDELIDHVTRQIDSYPEMQVEYYQIVDSLTMQPLHSWPADGEPKAVGCVTVYLGDVRLIDNITYDIQK